MYMCIYQNFVFFSSYMYIESSRNKNMSERYSTSHSVFFREEKLSDSIGVRAG